MALKAQVKGDTKNIAISEGSLNFDQSKLNFSLDAKNFDKPDVTFDLSLDQIDLDAYLPPSSKSKIQIEKKPGAAGPNKEKVDYAPLRKLAIEGKIRALALKVRGTQVQDLNLSVSGKDGFFRTQISISITNGVSNTPNTTMMSPVLRVVAAGKADLVKETLDFTVDPKFVGTLKGQGDTKERSGVVVPVMVAGTFSSPRFRPDLEKLFKQDFTKGRRHSRKHWKKVFWNRNKCPLRLPKRDHLNKRSLKTPRKWQKNFSKACHLVSDHIIGLLGAAFRPGQFSEIS